MKQAGVKHKHEEVKLYMKNMKQVGVKLYMKQVGVKLYMKQVGVKLYMKLYMKQVGSKSEERLFTRKLLLLLQQTERPKNPCFNTAKEGLIIGFPPGNISGDDDLNPDTAIIPLKGESITYDSPAKQWEDTLQKVTRLHLTPTEGWKDCSISNIPESKGESAFDAVT
ncbi:hypothetical protein CEXT_453561 [Caerostris extrusa]|uniref:Uncharacterized protein n=1 Tax=Caerostris extrusa TaxID=172846 RepID=A0AAV4NC27_CAEEX|nr:hypothetical protein CEXT_453561 [Caerostris extrusa]